MAKCFLQKCFLIFNTITDSFEVEKWETLEHVKSYTSKNVLLLILTIIKLKNYSICFGLFQVVCKWIVIWEKFLLPIFYKMLWSKCLFQKLLNFLSCLMPFLNAMKFRRFKTHWKIYFPFFFLPIANRGGIFVLKVCL